MKTNTFLSMALVGFAVLKTATMVYTSCGHNSCVCDDKGRFARCKPERGHTQLPYFPSLPSYISNVTFLNFKRPNILRDELLNSPTSESFTVSEYEYNIYGKGSISIFSTSHIIGDIK